VHKGIIYFLCLVQSQSYFLHSHEVIVSPIVDINDNTISNAFKYFVIHENQDEEEINEIYLETQSNIENGIPKSMVS